MKFKNTLDLIFGEDKRSAYITRLFSGFKCNAVNTHSFLGNMRNTTNTLNLRGLNGNLGAVANLRIAFISPIVLVLKRIVMISQFLRFLPISDWRQNTVSFLSILVLASTVYCKKDKGKFDLEWQNESLSLTAEICAKYRECADKEWKSIPENLKKFTEGRLEESQCQKRFRESNAYKLIGADPLAIQTAYKDCHKQILQFSCKDLQEGKMETVSSCVAFQKIQNGN